MGAPPVERGSQRVMKSMRVTAYQRLEAHLSEPSWALYQAAFDRLRIRAAQRHLMLRHEFDAVMADPRLKKLLVFDDASRGQNPVAMSAVTDDLDSVPLISPEYYAHRWPLEYAQRRIWYVVFLAVSSDYQGTGAATLLVGEVTRHLRKTGGVIAADFCTYNENTMKLPTLFLRMARTYSSGGSLERLDSQSYWACEFAAPGSVNAAEVFNSEVTDSSGFGHVA
jgi:ribosomal protein S18 acetylase RimI-like enzyme